MFEIGNSLREARLRRHIDFADAEHGTKIRGKYLRALEDERFELLPSHTYIKGFLRSYAEYLGLDGQLYVDEYNSRFVIGEEEAPVRARRVPAAKARRSDRRESRIVVLALAAITLVTALVIVAWRFGGPEEEPVHGLTTAQEQRPDAAPPPVAAGKARLELRATRGDSYLLVRRGSVLGELAYEGTLERGQKKFFDGQVLWIRLESPQNVLVRRNGNRVRLPAAVKAQGVFVTAKKIFAADPGLTGANGPRPRAVVVVTGSELVRGERTDLNGPFLARALLALGLEPTRIHVVGDDPAELEAAVAEAVATADLVATSGGLGPTHDDRTVAVVAKVAGLALRVDPGLEEQIEAVSRMVAERMKRPYADFSDGVTKQATVPEPSAVLGLAGTAPGLVVEAGGTPVVILPGPPTELRRLWPRALETDEVRRVLDRGTPPLRRTLRFFGPGESQVAQAFHEAGGDGDGVEVTICARSFEIHVDLVAEPEAEPRLIELEGELSKRLGRFLFSTDGRSVEELVLDRCRELGWSLATAESCTGGLVAAGLTAIPGSTDVVTGGIVAYSNEVKVGELDVPVELIERHGAVSAEVAEAMARGARERLGVDVAVSVTGIAGPGGGTEDKPVGLVYFHAETPKEGKGGFFSFPGDRDSIRRRSVVASLHLLRRLLEQNRDKAV